MKRISDLFIDWFIKGSSINWNYKTIEKSTTWILLLKLTGLSHWNVKHSWALLKSFISFCSHWIMWVAKKVWQQFCPTGIRFCTEDIRPGADQSRPKCHFTNISSNLQIHTLPEKNIFSLTSFVSLISNV